MGNTQDSINYYANLLILQYVGKPKAYATIQATVNPVIMPQTTVETIAFSPPPTSGSFVLSYNGVPISTIQWNDSAATIQGYLDQLPPNVFDAGAAPTAFWPTVYDDGMAPDALYAVLIDGGNAFGYGLGAITVTGSIASGLLTITFNGVPPPAALLTLVSSTLLSGGNPVTVTITETDLSLPLAVQAGFNLTGPNPATGKQLDTLGKYAGVVRTGLGFQATITLNDADFLVFIQLATVRNSAGSSLATIETLLNQFFAGQISVTDYANMSMVFTILTGIGSANLIQLMVTEGLLPRPMGVGQTVVLADPLDAFGFELSTNSGGFGDLSDASIGGKFASLF